MEYISTRNQVPSVPFSIAVEHGLAPDGGLYIPKELPNLEPYLKAWSALDYPDLCKAFSHFLPQIFQRMHWIQSSIALIAHSMIQLSLRSECYLKSLAFWSYFMDRP